MQRRYRDLLRTTCERFSTDMYRYLCFLMGSRRGVEDVMQEVFLRLLPAPGASSLLKQDGG